MLDFNQKIEFEKFNFDVLGAYTSESFSSEVQKVSSAIDSAGLGNVMSESCLMLYVSEQPTLYLKVYLYYFDTYVDIFKFYYESGNVVRSSFNMEDVEVALLLSGCQRKKNRPLLVLNRLIKNG